ncbi:hypothetical protein R1P36_005188 [Escherichia coli]|nr:hypothetical protein [Escherichia coli]
MLSILAIILSQPAYPLYIENRFTSVEKQQSDSTCGIASLSNIQNSRYHIKRTKLESLKYLSIKPEYSFKDLSFIVCEHNINTEGIKLHLSQLSELNIPAILHISINCFGHVVANTFSGDFRYFIVVHFIPPTRLFNGIPNHTIYLFSRVCHRRNT